MVFSGMENMGETPFKHVFIHGLVRDSDGRKMSKSLGNGIDPLEVIDKYGADALRFSLVTGNSPGNDMRFYYERVEANRNFANKLWNATRFVLMNLSDDFVPTESDAVEDRWIRSRVQETAKSMTGFMDKFELGMAAQEIYDCIWDVYCDWYIELVKPRLYGDDVKSKNAALTTLLDALSDMLKLLHPFMPFITEEIWSHLPDRDSALIQAQWPVRDQEADQAAVDQMEYMIEAIRTIRNARSELNVIPSKKAKIFIESNDEWAKATLLNHQGFLKTLASASEVAVIDSADSLSEEAVTAVIEKAKFYLPLAELVDFKKEIERLEKEKARLEGELKRVNGKLSNKKFTDKAPQAVVEAERQKKAKYEDMMQSVLERLAKM
jgi:valyl-tRNA synthetase